MIINKKEGFTLIELMVVLLLVGLTVTVTVPLFHGALGRCRLHLAARQMITDIREVEYMALSREDTYKVKFYIDPDRVNPRDKYYIMQGISVIKSIELPAGVNLYGTNFYNDRFYINASGYPMGGFGGTIHLENDSDKHLYIIIAKTGRVRMDDHPPPD
ncbi:MAG: prepilin-type N-terminal cleavage/methylation domain-containing protein [Clostridiales bacterium]|nr:prepilin-type N-terminal cleavage/methylation domain-containing protein [Clostridiales bacterium]MCF8021152.1 prepilin-type N-terminal cleavage/methylation domain-containing protein [Clostridiales bacterium]